MAKNSSSKSTSSSNLLDILGYVAVVVGGIALFAAMILGKLGISASLVTMLQKIANIIGWIVLCALSFKFIRNKKKVWMWVVWAIAFVMIIVGIILV